MPHNYPLWRLLHSSLIWDGLFAPNPFTRCAFVSAEGHVDVLRRYGYAGDLYNAGWAYSQLLPFKPSPNLRKILFAPIHPNANSWLSKIDKEINRKTYELLLEVCQSNEIELHVRFIGQLHEQGLFPHSYPKFMHSTPDMTHALIHDYDLIVSHQTFAFIAVALGKPTLMMDEWQAPRNGKDDSSVVTVSSWDSYKDLAMYPLDILGVSEPLKLMREACGSDERIRDWRGAQGWPGSNAFLPSSKESVRSWPISSRSWPILSDKCQILA